MSILDASFRYVPASKTNIRRTFERIRRELKEQAAKEQANVRTLKARSK